MLASITPLGERGRRMRWGHTVTSFMIGATVAGAVAGALLGAAGSLGLPASFGAEPRLMVLAAAALIALALDAGPLPVPGPRRQVNERWRDRLRGWVYGLGYGAQLGLGAATIVSSAATYVALLAAFLAGGPGRGALVVGLAGAVRGATPLLAAGVRRPDQLIALHLRLARWRAPAGRIGHAVLVVILALSAAGSLA